MNLDRQILTCWSHIESGYIFMLLFIEFTNNIIVLWINIKNKDSVWL